VKKEEGKKKRNERRKGKGRGRNAIRREKTAQFSPDETRG